MTGEQCMESVSHQKHRFVDSRGREMTTEHAVSLMSKRFLKKKRVTVASYSMPSSQGHSMRLEGYVIS